nr:arginine--tRNA ligase, chloroplastic/mitochondrial [Tanacetum cinerariifolium]
MVTSEEKGARKDACYTICNGESKLKLKKFWEKDRQSKCDTMSFRSQDGVLKIYDIMLRDMVYITMKLRFVSPVLDLKDFKVRRPCTRNKTPLALPWERIPRLDSGVRGGCLSARGRGKYPSMLYEAIRFSKKLEQPLLLGGREGVPDYCGLEHKCSEGWDASREYVFPRGCDDIEHTSHPHPETTRSTTLLSRVKPHILPGRRG